MTDKPLGDDPNDPDNIVRTIHEFQCTEGYCLHWNYPTLRSNMNGNYTIKCGNCGHQHYRVLKNGVVTEDRHNEAYDHGDTIIVPKAATQKTKRERGLIAQFRDMVVAGLAR